MNATGSSGVDLSLRDRHEVSADGKVAVPRTIGYHLSNHELLSVVGDLDLVDRSVQRIDDITWRSTVIGEASILTPTEVRPIDIVLVCHLTAALSDIIAPYLLF